MEVCSRAQPSRAGARVTCVLRVCVKVRRGELTLTLEWDGLSDSQWARRVRVKWWGEPGDGRLIRRAATAGVVASPG